MFDFSSMTSPRKRPTRAIPSPRTCCKSWADAEWFTSRPEVPQSITAHRAQGARRNQHRRPVARTRRLEPPRHPAALRWPCSRTSALTAFTPEEDGKRGPVKFIEDLREKGQPRGLRGRRGGHGFEPQVGHQQRDLWFTGEDIPFVPNKRFGGVCLGSKIAPIFYNTHGRRGLAAHRSGREAKIEHGRRDRHCCPTTGKALKDGEP